MRQFLKRTILLLLVVSAALLPAVSWAQSTTDLIRGRVSGPGGSSLVGVRVAVVSLVTQMTRSAITDSSGRYTVVFPNGGGNYVAQYSLIAFTPVVRQVRRLNDEALLVADIVMNPAPFVLSSVVVTGRPLPERGSGEAPDSTGMWDWITGAGLSLGDIGNLMLMAAQLPGVQLVTDDGGYPVGISVLGLGSEQNILTVDGVEQNMNMLPTEGMPEARLTTTTSDPSRGGFSGASVAVQSKPGTWQVTRSLGLTVEEPRMQFSDRVGRQIGKEYSNVRLSGQTSGPLIKDLLFFRGSFQAGRRSSDRASILTTGELGFRELGASLDSVARLLSLMQGFGIPVTRPGIPSTQLTRDGSLMLRGDLTPAGSHALNATLNASWRSQVSVASSPLVAPARGGENESISTAAQLNHSFYFPFSVLSETKLAFSSSYSGSDAYLDLPDVRVRVSGVNETGRTSTANFQLGGNSSMPTASRNSKWQLSNFLSWASRENAHRVKFGVEMRYDDISQTQESNSLGTFTFNSLSAFADGEGAEYRRQLSVVRKGADLFTTAFSLGDQWRRTKNLNIQYGIRVELDHYGARPQYNPAVEESFGVRNDQAPNDIHFIPRFGFTWTYGTAPQIAAFEGAARGPKATLKGTIGEYRNTPSNSLLQSAMGSTGLPDGIQILSCKGDAVPDPDWSLYTQDPSALPDECADGTGSTVFASSQPSVLLFGEDYEPERSWRADLGWSGTALRRWKLSVGGLLSFNHAQTASLDLNFVNHEFFSLPLEAGRPVFVSPSSISSRSGSVATREARLSSDFSRVTERRSDLQSFSTQLTLSLSPVVVSPRGVKWSLSYARSTFSEFKRGLGGTTASDPLLRAWGPGKNPEHQIGVSLNYSILGFKLGLSARATSGVRYTPMVRGDINGDGESNDRAFVFNPELTADSALAAGMLELIRSAPGSARRCLRRQVGLIAGTNSCVGPWSTTANLSLSLDAMKLVLPGRTTLQMSFGNPMTGIDLLVNGRSKQKSWGQQNNSPDATLLYVRGFDPAARQFRYEVNSAFGSNKVTRATQGKPFAITLAFSTDVSPSLERQKLKRLIEEWETGVARRPPEAALRRQYTQPFVTIFESILKQKDTLGLSATQADSLASMSAVYFSRLDSLWGPMARELAVLSGGRAVQQAHSQIQDLRRTSFVLMSAHAQEVRLVLTPEQFNRLPSSYGLYFDERAMRRMR